MKKDKCEICGAELIGNERNAICITVCCADNNSVSISNMAYCNDCFRHIVYDKLKALNDVAGLNILLEGVKMDGGKAR